MKEDMSVGFNPQNVGIDKCVCKGCFERALEVLTNSN